MYIKNKDWMERAAGSHLQGCKYNSIINRDNFGYWYAEFVNLIAF